MRPTLALPGLALLLLLPACERGGGGGGGAGESPLATELSVEQVSIYQGTESILMEDQEEVGPTAQVVAGRDALIRVFVFPHNDWEDREIEAKLELIQMEQNDDGDWEEGSKTRMSETMDVVIESSDSSLSSTFNFYVDGEDITEGLAYRVSLHESGNEDGAGSGDMKSPHWPDPGDEPQAMQPRSAGESVRVVIIPLEYRADGSGRMPDVSDSQIELLRDQLLAQYPVPDVEIEVEDAVAWPNPIYPNGAGFDRVIDYLYNIRDRYPYDVYLYAMFAPSSTYFDFCQGGCVAGLSSVARSPGDSWARVSTGLGYSGEGTAGTMVHEIGHAHGRGHAPCGTQGDGAFPHQGASIGAWGFDIVRRVLKSPNQFTDFMGYCDPTWVSDYTFDELFDRIRAVNDARGMQRIEAMPTFNTVLLTSDGELDWSRDIRLPGLSPGGTPMQVELLDASGAVIDVVQGRLNGFNHLPGGHLQFPAVGPDVASVRIVDHGTLAVR